MLKVMTYFMDQKNIEIILVKSEKNQKDKKLLNMINTHLND